jgi:hypothetical protein
MRLGETHRRFDRQAMPPQVDVGDNSQAAGSPTIPSVLRLGQTNTVFADSVAVGRGKTDNTGASMVFNSAFSSPTALFRGSNGIFSRGRRLPPEPLTGTFIAPSAPLHVPAAVVIALSVIALALPLVVRSGYVLQTLGIGWLYAILAISLTLVAGTAGQISLGHAGLLAIGAYASALLAIDLKIPVAAAVVCAGLVTAVLGTLIVLPSFRLRGHYVTIATLGIGEIVTLVILNWDSLTHGPIGLTAIPPLSVLQTPILCRIEKCLMADN